jgi:integrase/recombinase XerD
VDFLRAKGNGKRTVSNRVSYVLIFLRKQGFKDVIHPSDVPKYTEKIVKAYSTEQLQPPFEAADEEDFVLFHFFLGSGRRDNEVVHACWEDVDFRAETHDVREKLELQFTVKDNEEWTIPLPSTLVDLLRKHRERHPKGRLVFPGKKRGGMNHTCCAA